MKPVLIDGLFEDGADGDLEVPRHWFGGPGAHPLKFKEAHSLLPEECIVYHMADVCYDQEKIPRDHAERLEGGMDALKACHATESKFYKMSGVEPPEHYRGYVVTREHDRTTGRTAVTLSTPLPYDAGRVFVTVPYDFATRKNMLYADWDDEKKRWNTDATIGPTKYVASDDDIRRSVEVDKDESELYPDAVLGAISAFRGAVSARDWKSGSKFAG